MSANPQFNFLSATFKVLVSVSLFSFVISQYSSLILPLLLQSADEFSSSFSVNHLFRYSSERNIVFLLCNGLLVLIITNSGLIATPPRSHESRREKPTANPKVIMEVKIAQVEEEEEEVARKKGDETHERVISIHHHHQEEEEEEESKEIVTFSGHHHHQEEEEEEEEERKKGDDEIVQIYSDHHHHHEGEGGEENEVGGDDDDDDDDDEEDGDELEKKCEEFIKRMKQDMMRK